MLTRGRHLDSHVSSISSRVVHFITFRPFHQGETPASHVLDGVLEFLMREGDPRAIALRQRFVFKLVPMLNPDGVYRGHFRADSRGVDLNRSYATATAEEQPSTYAVMALVRQLHERGALWAYIDCHAHSNQRGCFFYANALGSDALKREATLYSQLVGLNARWFETGSCSWRASAQRGGNAGSARSAIFAATGLPLVFTLECNYDSPTDTGIDALVLPEGPINYWQLPGSRPTAGAADDADPPLEHGTPTKYTPASWREVGRGLALAALDMSGANPASRLGPSDEDGLEKMHASAPTFKSYLDEEDDDG